MEKHIYMHIYLLIIPSEQGNGCRRGRGNRTEASKMEGDGKGFELMDVRFTGRLLMT
jgi:hypothetical protein